VDIASCLCVCPAGSVTFINANIIAASSAHVVVNAAFLVSLTETANCLCGPCGPGYVQVPQVDIASCLCACPAGSVTLTNVIIIVVSFAHVVVNVAILAPFMEATYCLCGPGHAQVPQVDIDDRLCAHPAGSTPLIGESNIVVPPALLVNDAVLASHKEAANCLSVASGLGNDQDPQVAEIVMPNQPDAFPSEVHEFFAC
jgi:hypothetical protein